MKTQLQQLAEPFPPALVKAPPKGKYGSYVNHATVTERLLSILGPFSFRVVEVIRGYAPKIVTTKNTWNAREDAIVGVIGELTAVVDGRTVVIAEIGTEDTPAMHNDAENAKNAASDALKRCAMRLGCGLHLWSGTDYFLDRQLAKNTAPVSNENDPLALAPTPDPGVQGEGPGDPEGGDSGTRSDGIPAEGSATQRDARGDVSVAAGEATVIPDGVPPDTPEKVMKEEPGVGTIDEIRDRVNRLYAGMEFAGIWESDAFRHHLAKFILANNLTPKVPGEVHWGDLRRKEHMVTFVEAAFSAAERDIERNQPE